ncbi:MAG: hypothetical protein KME10_03920 [Plectolyngbya sp. WJT66-NPBG17]|nr:hypothetical protein [Plectolyngbya sp. WJT66-NPBG17]
MTLQTLQPVHPAKRSLPRSPAAPLHQIRAPPADRVPVKPLQAGKSQIEPRDVSEDDRLILRSRRCFGRSIKALAVRIDAARSVPGLLVCLRFSVSCDRPQRMYVVVDLKVLNCPA